jgi:exodeoxyribonuclease VII large subunit
MICSTLDRAKRQLIRLANFRVVDARARVQEQAMSQAFSEVQARLRDAKVTTNGASHRLQLLLSRTLHQAHLRTDALYNKLSLNGLERRVKNARERFEVTRTAHRGAIEGQLEKARQQLSLAAASLDALSPLAVLHRGYAIAMNKEGHLLRDSKSVSTGDAVQVRLAKGRLETIVQHTED